MFIEEKIDLLKQKYPKCDFSIPFIHVNDILKKIEQSFIKVKNVSGNEFSFSNSGKDWPKNLKTEYLFKKVTDFEDLKLIELLHSKTNYWFVFISNPSSNKYWLFDCKGYTYKDLRKIFNSFIYIVDKKYNWLIELNIIEKEIKILNKSQTTFPFVF